MPIDPRELEPYAAREFYQSDYPCRRCGYNLKGLQRGSKCPECGFQHRAGRGGSVLAARDNLLYAPLGYLKLLQFGAVLMAIGVVGAGLLAAAGVVGASEQARAGARLIVGAIWLAGVWILTQPRQVSERTPVNPRQEWKVTRWVNRGLQACWLPAGLLALAAWRNPPAVAIPGAGPTTLELLSGLFAIAGVVGLVPLAIQIADLAEWGSDSGLAGRLRGSAWGLTVFGVIVYLGGFAPQLLGPFAFFLTIPLLVAAVMWLISLAAFGVSVLQLATMTSWAIDNSHHLAERDRRATDRDQRDQRAAKAGLYRQARGVALERESTAGRCPQCGYDLAGLPPNRPCPECGNDLSPMPVRPLPVSDKPVWLADDSPIPLAPEKPRRQR